MILYLIIFILCSIILLCNNKVGIKSGLEDSSFNNLLLCALFNCEFMFHVKHGDIMDEYFMNLAFNEALIAYDLGEVPVGCVIVSDNVVIAAAHNLKEKNNDVTCHAEIMAIREASKYKKNWRLDDCILYTTVEPCSMCMGAIRESRIGKVFFSVKSPSIKSYYKDICVERVAYKYDESLKLLKSFFESVRKN